MYGFSLHIGALALSPRAVIGSYGEIIGKRGQILNHIAEGPYVDLVTGQIGQPGAVGVFGRRRSRQGSNTPHRTGICLIFPGLFRHISSFSIVTHTHRALKLLTYSQSTALWKDREAVWFRHLHTPGQAALG